MKMDDVEIPEFLYYSSDSEVASADDDEKCDADTINQTIDPRSQNEWKNVQKRLEIRMVTGQQFPSIVEELDVSQHSTTDILDNANDVQHIWPVLLSDGNTESNSVQISSGRMVVPVSTQAEEIPHPRYPKITISLISDDEEAESYQVNKAKNVVAESVPMNQRQKRKCDMAEVSEKRNEKQKFAETTKRHKCGFCEYSSQRKSTVENHIRTHTGKQAYQYEYCAKQFTKKTNLNDHLKTKIHSELFAFKCSKCRQGFHKKVCAHRMKCVAWQSIMNAGFAVRNFINTRAICHGICAHIMKCHSVAPIVQNDFTRN